MNVKGVLIDLDGVLYSGDHAIPGAPEAIDYLKSRGYKVRYLSNSTRRSRIEIAKRLRSFGFGIETEEIFTPSSATIRYVARLGYRNCHLLTTDALSTEFSGAGLPGTDKDVDCVIIGDAGDRFTYERMNLAFRLIQNGAPIIALEMDRYWMGNDGLMLSAGPFVRALEYSTGRSAVLMGKPSPMFFKMALADIGIDPREAAMIGDDVVTDTGGAMKIGLCGILVRTGKFTPDALENADPWPTHVISSIADIKEIL